MKCSNRNHRNYQAKRKPRVACEACWRMWFDAEWLRARQREREEIARQNFEANGGKDRPTDSCTSPHGPRDVCYGCDPYYRSHQ